MKILEFNIESTRMKFYTCPMCCNLGFTSAQDLKDHLIKAASSVICPECKKSFKNILYLIKHLDDCGSFDDVSKSLNESEISDLDINLDVSLDNDLEEDIENYFCTVCDIKIPDVSKHIQQFHSGQEIILQDDDEDENDDDINIFQPSSAQSSDSTNDRMFDEKSDNNVNTFQEDKFHIKSEVDKEKIPNGQVFYCRLCDATFPALTEHTAKHHKGVEVLVHDLAIHELFPASRQSNGTFAYFCTCCQKIIARKRTLAKHLKLFHNKFEKIKKGKCQRKRSKSTLSNYSENSFTIKNQVRGEKSNSDTMGVEDIKAETCDFDDISHSIFNT